MTGHRFIPDDGWAIRQDRSYDVRASCPRCGKDLQLAMTAPPSGVCGCGYSVEICGDRFPSIWGKTCVREKGHRGWHLSPSATGWGEVAAETEGGGRR